MSDTYTNVETLLDLKFSHTKIHGHWLSKKYHDWIIEETCIGHSWASAGRLQAISPELVTSAKKGGAPKEKKGKKLRRITDRETFRAGYGHRRWHARSL